MAFKDPIKYEGQQHRPYQAGDTVHPHQVPLSADAGNALEARADGLYVEESEGTIHTLDTATVDLSGDGSSASPLQAAARVSAASGNLLTTRADGLYYGIEAAPSIATLYVSTTLGNDANAGTVAAPLATVNEAFQRQVNAPVSYRILLRSGEEFEAVGNYDRSLAYIAIGVYGEPVYQGFSISPSCAYDPANGQEFQRARLTFVVNGTTQNIAKISASRLSFSGLIMDVSNPSAVSLLGVGNWLASSGDTAFKGCLIDTGGAGFAPAISSPTVVLQRCQVTGSQPLMRTTGNSPRITSLLTSGATDGCSLYPPYTPVADNVRALPLNRLVLSPAHDPATKTQFNYNTSWDPWAGGGGGGGGTPTPPVASFGVTGSGLTVNFSNGSVATGGATLVSHAWNFGDGNTSSTASPSHTYAAAGTYSVSLLVTDSNSMTASVAHNVVVTAPGGGGGGGGGGGDDPGPPTIED